MIGCVGGAVGAVLSAQFRGCEVFEARYAGLDLGEEGGVIGEEFEGVAGVERRVAGEDEEVYAGILLGWLFLPCVLDLRHGGGGASPCFRKLIAYYYKVVVVFYHPPVRIPLGMLNVYDQSISRIREPRSTLRFGVGAFAALLGGVGRGGGGPVFLCARVHELCD